MKKVRIPLMIQDPLTAARERLSKMTEGYDAVRPYFLDGPVTERVAVVDFERNTGELRKGVRYNSGEKLDHTRGHYEGKTWSEPKKEDHYTHPNLCR